MSTLIGAFLVHVVVGSQYAWGNMSPYIVSYYRNIGHEHVNQSQFYAILPIIVVVSTLTFPLGMYLTNQYGSRKVIFCGALFCCFATFVSSIAKQPATFFVVYAGAFGIGKGFLYPAPLRAAWSHLPGRTGFVSGFIVSGLGVGAFVYGFIISLLVNPDNKHPVRTEIQPDVFEHVFKKEISDRVPRMLFILGICWAVQLFVGLILITNYVKPEVQIEDSEANWEDMQIKKLEEIASKTPIMKAVCSKEFYHLYLIAISQIFYGYYIINSFKSYGQDYIEDD